MSVLLVSIGTELLFGDILNTNAAHISRRLQENNIPLVTQVIVDDHLERIVEVLRLGLARVDVVLTVGGLGQDDNDFTHEAIRLAAVGPDTGEQVAKAEDTAQSLEEYPLAGAIPLGGPEVSRRGFIMQDKGAALICLPGKPQDMAYLLETEVLPFLLRHSDRMKVFGTRLLRTAGIMESNLEQQLIDLKQGEEHHISFSSFAGQTDIGLWVERETREEVDVALEKLAEQVLERLGHQVYGFAGDSLEAVLTSELLRHHVTIGVAECNTGRSLADRFGSVADSEVSVRPLRAGDGRELADYLDLERIFENHDLTGWCRKAADKVRIRTEAELGLVIYNDISPGGVQILVTLASSEGLSMMQRSFGGHPDNINRWASTLGLVHIRRWLLTRHPPAGVP